MEFKMVDAVESKEESNEKIFTVVALPAVIWAKIGEKSLSLRVQGEPLPVTIDASDELFNYYRDKFSENKAEMLAADKTPVE